MADKDGDGLLNKDECATFYHLIVYSHFHGIIESQLDQPESHLEIKKQIISRLVELADCLVVLPGS